MRRSDGRESGWALVSVLWVVSMLAMMAAATEALTVTSYRVAQRGLDQARFDSILDAGIIRAVAGITDPDPSSRWRVDGVAQNFTFDGYAMRIAVQDQLGCIDLNAADESLLRALLISVGIPDDKTAALTDNIVGWRSSASFHTLHGASDADYAAKGYAYHPRHEQFQTADELKLVMGMTSEIFAKLRPALTVYSKRPMIDTQIAPAAALRALYPHDPDGIDRIMSVRQNNANAGKMVDGLSEAGHSFSIIATIKQGRQIFERRAVVELTGDPKKPYFVLAWE